MPTPTDAAEQVVDQIQRAYTMVSMLCTGEREWLMSIPARPDHDPDLVIGHALQAAKSLIDAQAAALTAARAEVETWKAEALGWRQTLVDQQRERINAAGGMGMFMTMDDEPTPPTAADADGTPTQRDPAGEGVGE